MKKLLTTIGMVVLCASCAPPPAGPTMNCPPPPDNTALAQAVDRNADQIKQGADELKLGLDGISIAIRESAVCDSDEDGDTDQAPPDKDLSLDDTKVRRVPTVPRSVGQKKESAPVLPAPLQLPIPETPTDVPPAIPAPVAPCKQEAKQCGSDVPDVEQMLRAVDEVVPPPAWAVQPK